MAEIPTRALVRKDDLIATRIRTPQLAHHDSLGGPSVGKNDILYALFKHKKKILLGALAGLASAAGVYFFYAAVYESDAKLLVRYLVERSTVEKPFGWVFFYNSKKFLDTGEFRYRLAGNGPIVVNKHDGSVEFFGASRPPLEIVAEYEQKLARGEKP